MLAAEIATRLSDAGVGTKGTSIWVNEAAEPDYDDSGTGDGVVIRPYPGGRPLRTGGSTGADPSYDREFFQIIALSSDPVTAWTLAASARAALDWWNGTLDGTLYSLIELVQSPGSLDPDASLRYRVVASYEARKARS